MKVELFGDAQLASAIYASFQRRRVFTGTEWCALGSLKSRRITLVLSAPAGSS